MARKPPMTEEEMERSVRRGKVFNYTAFGILMTLLLFAGIGLLKHHDNHTFTTEKWRNNPDGRMQILQDLLEKQPLVGMTRDEVISLLGPGEQQTSFAGKMEGTQEGDLLVYSLGVDLMDVQWLILHVKADRIVSIVCDVT